MVIVLVTNAMRKTQIASKLKSVYMQNVDYTANNTKYCRNRLSRMGPSYFL